MSRRVKRAHWGPILALTAALAIACGVKAPPRPPLPRPPPAADGGQPDAKSAESEASPGDCRSADGGCGP